jgi:radical SAM-linked protein
MDKLRLHFSKTGRAVFLSHLDLMQVWRRALLRAGTPLRYSEGYNPHAVLSIPLPLPVGVAGLNELLDFGVTAPVALRELPERLNAALPEGIAALSASVPGKPAGDIAAARYELSFSGAAEFAPELRAVFDGQALPVEKRSKRGSATVDIAPLVRVERVTMGGDGALRLTAVLPTRDPALAPEHLLAAIRAEWPGSEAYAARAARLAILDGEGVTF